MQLRNLKIGLRAACMFVLLGVLVLVMGLVSLYETRQMDRATDEIRVTWMPAVISLGDVSSALGRARALTLRSALEEQPSARKATLEKITEINQTLQGNLDDYERTIIADDDRALFNTFLQMSERYHGMRSARARASSVTPASPSPSRVSRRCQRMTGSSRRSVR